MAIVLAVTGPHLVHLYDTTVADCAKTRRLLDGVIDVPPERPHPADPARWPCRGGARHRRDLLGGAARRPRARDRHLPAGMDPERHPHPLAGGEARPRRTGQHGRGRAPQPDGDVVVKPGRPGQHQPVHVVRSTRTSCPSAMRHSPSPGRTRRRAHPPDPPGHGRHPGRVREPPDCSSTTSCCPKLIAPVHGSFPLNRETGPGVSAA